MKYLFSILLITMISFSVVAADDEYYPVTATSGAGSHPNILVTFAAFESVADLDFYEYRCRIYPSGYPGWEYTFKARYNSECLYQGILASNANYLMEIELIDYPDTTLENLLAKTQLFVLHTGESSVEINPAKVIYTSVTKTKVSRQKPSIRLDDVRR